MPCRYCCVAHCHNNCDTVKEWEKNICEKYKTINGNEHCDCKLPFFLIPFPTKNSELPEEWIQRVHFKIGKLIMILQYPLSISKILFQEKKSIT